MASSQMAVFGLSGKTGMGMVTGAQTPGKQCELDHPFPQPLQLLLSVLTSSPCEAVLHVCGHVCLADSSLWETHVMDRGIGWMLRLGRKRSRSRL